MTTGSQRRGATFPHRGEQCASRVKDNDETQKHIGSAGRPIARLYRVGEADVGVLRRRTRVSISASPAHRLLMGRGTGEAKAKMGRENTFVRGNVERCHISGLRIGSRRKRGSLVYFAPSQALPTALPFAVRIRILRLLRFCPLRLVLIRQGRM